MSHQITSASSNFHTNTFRSGVVNDTCIQITGKDKMRGSEKVGFVQMTREEARLMAETLLSFANGNEIQED